MRSTFHPSHHNIQGVSLVEMLVGIVIGLMTLAVAMGALMASRSATSTVGDASNLQQQASHVFRILSQQIRQTGSLRLNLATQKSDDAVDFDANDVVAFEAKTLGFDPKVDTLLGIDTPSSKQYKLTTGYRNYKEPLHVATPPDTLDSLQRDCLGQQDSSNLNRIRSQFVLTGTDLMCAGSGNPQPIASNVANFQIRYLVQTFPSGFGDPQLKYVNAATVANNWSNVYGVEICLVFFGTEVLPAGASYTDCTAADGTTATVKTDTLAAPRTNRMHKVFRSVFQLRSQGLIASY